VRGNSFELYLNGEFLKNIQTTEELVITSRAIREQLEKGISAQCIVETEPKEDQYTIMAVSKRWNTVLGRVVKNGKVVSDVMNIEECEMYIEHLKREGKK
jgi:hypothetical protein